MFFAAFRQHWHEIWTWNDELLGEQQTRSDVFLHLESRLWPSDEFKPNIHPLLAPILVSTTSCGKHLALLHVHQIVASFICRVAPSRRWAVAGNDADGIVDCEPKLWAERWWNSCKCGARVLILCRFVSTSSDTLGHSIHSQDENIDYSSFKSSDHQKWDYEGVRGGKSQYLDDRLAASSSTFHLRCVQISTTASSTDGVFF